MAGWDHLKLGWILIVLLFLIVIVMPILGLSIKTGVRVATVRVFRTYYWWIRKALYRLECRISLWGKDDDYATGYKTAFVVYDPKSKAYSFAPLRASMSRPQEGIYGTEANAVCTKYSSHKAPVKNCRCGFHALKLHRHVGKVRGSEPLTSRWRSNSLAVLQVDLSGDVITGTLGYRASHQRVLQVRLARRCTVCYQEKHFWQRAKPAVSIVKQSQHDGLEYVLGVCPKHQGPQTTDIAVLGNILQTEVVWA